MVNPRKKVKEDVWIGIIVGVIVVYALLAEWWKTHAVLGWVILGIVLIIAGYVVYKYASVRGWLGSQVKSTLEQVVFEKVASGREPLSPETRAEVMKRAQSKCENQQCTSPSARPHIHHIDGNNQHNSLSNLIALCPNDHQAAHDDKLTESQLINWVRRDYQRLKVNGPNKSKGYCIRCDKSIAYNSKAPYCPDCYGIWAKFKNSDYEEKHCHKCGASNKSVSMNRPLCVPCFKESKR